MIEGISKTLYQTSSFSGKTDALGDKSFADILASNNSLQTENSIEIPDKWRTGDSAESSNGIDIAVKFMRDKLGIDVSQREPTHEITEEQKEWLTSRHDLDNIHNYAINTLEMQNFLGDLVYLNVYTPDEAMKLRLVALPSHTGMVGHVDGVGSDGIFSSASVRNFAEMIARTIDTQRSIIEYIKAKYEDPARSEKEDGEYIQKASDFMANKQECYNALLTLFE